MGIKAAVMIHGEKMEKSVGQTKHKIENKADVVKLFFLTLLFLKQFYILLSKRLNSFLIAQVHVSNSDLSDQKCKNAHAVAGLVARQSEVTRSAALMQNLPFFK